MANWDDLRPRVMSGVAMAVVGLLAIVAGGVWFQTVVVAVTAGICWEIWKMIHGKDGPFGMAVTACAALILSVLFYFPMSPLWVILLLLVLPVAGALMLTRERGMFFAYILWVMIAGFGMVYFRLHFGLGWFLWLVGVVVATDIAGYFVGKSFGGPKFWPAISPKKTWSGTIGGWIGAALVGLVFVLVAGAPWWCLPLSVLVSFAGQMGDIAESALKRRQGVKDSSQLIPGHGGLFDRFDALMGAALFMLIAVGLFGLGV